MLCLSHSITNILIIEKLLIYTLITIRNVVFCSDIKCGIPGTSLKSGYNKTELMNTKVVDIGSKIKYRFASFNFISILHLDILQL